MKKFSWKDDDAEERRFTWNSLVKLVCPCKSTCGAHCGLIANWNPNYDLNPAAPPHPSTSHLIRAVTQISDQETLTLDPDSAIRAGLFQSELLTLRIDEEANSL